MTDDLRAIDREAAELMGFETRLGWQAHGTFWYPNEPYIVGAGAPFPCDGSEECRGGENCVCWPIVPDFSSHPAAANLLIEDLRKRDYDFTMRYAWEVGEWFVSGWHVHSGIDSKKITQGGTWTEAVARFYIAVREANDDD